MFLPCSHNVIISEFSSCALRKDTGYVFSVAKVSNKLIKVVHRMYIHISYLQII